MSIFSLKMTQRTQLEHGPTCSTCIRIIHTDLHIVSNRLVVSLRENLIISNVTDCNVSCPFSPGAGFKLSIT